MDHILLKRIRYTQTGRQHPNHNYKTLIRNKGVYALTRSKTVVCSVPVNSVHPILKPFRFLKQHRDQHHGGDRNGNDGIDDGEYDQVDQDLRF